MYKTRVVCLYKLNYIMIVRNQGLEDLFLFNFLIFCMHNHNCNNCSVLNVRFLFEQVNC